MIYYIIILLMTFIGAFASYFLKKASSFKSIRDLIFNKNLYIGGTLYLVAACLNIVVLRYLSYSIVLPLTSLTYVWTMILAYFLLKEYVSRKKIVGTILIIVGAIVLVC